MYSNLIIFKYHDSELIVVPSIHFHHVFATEVNRICSHPDTRPDAIAVELGNRTAAAARNWLKELPADQRDHKSLPVMLGLMKRNRLIRASYKKKAFRLQKKFGCDLSELSPDVLNRELGFAGYVLLCLSPTDSIVEAMRCALELDLPLFGVDLEEMADSDFKPTVIQDPRNSNGDLKTYIVQNATYAKKQRDDEIDDRREIAMAARIKTLLGQFKRVLFVCGMAHWLDIKRLLEDSAIRPALIPEQSKETPEGFKRVVVHPLIAIKYMDLFPALVEKYEKLRRPAYELEDDEKPKQKIDPFKIFKNCLNKTYTAYFCGKAQELDRNQRDQDLEIRRDFEGYLGNLCFLSHRVVPDLFMTIKAAQDIMSGQFVKHLSNTLMRFPWASPEEYPLLAPPSDRRHESGCGTLTENGMDENKKYFYIKSISSSYRNPISVEIDYEWEKDNKTGRRTEGSSSLHTYAPWDYLVTALSLRAINLSVKKYINQKTEIFSGNLMDGIAIKSSLRSFSRGKEVPYVKDVREKNIHYVSRTGDGFPIVWILKTDDQSGSDWNVLYEPYSYIAKYVRDRNRLKAIRSRRGGSMVALITYGRKGIKSQASGLNSKISTDCHHGIVFYQPICWTNQQFANWAELTGYKRNPFCRNPYLDKTCAGDLMTFFEKEHDIGISTLDWPTVLILLAIPFARDVVTVAAPENYPIDRVVFEKAKKYGVEVLKAPLNVFSKRELDTLSVCHMVPAITHDPKCIYSESVEKAIGELQTHNRELVPRKWLDFGY